MRECEREKKKLRRISEMAAWHGIVMPIERQTIWFRFSYMVWVIVQGATCDRKYTIINYNNSNNNDDENGTRSRLINKTCQSLQNWKMSWARFQIELIIKIWNLYKYRNESFSNRSHIIKWVNDDNGPSIQRPSLNLCVFARDFHQQMKNKQYQGN